MSNTTQIIRAHAAMSAQTAFAALAPRYADWSVLAAVVGAQGGPASESALHRFDISGFLSARLRFIGTGADNSTYDYRLWAAHAALSGEIFVDFLGSGTATLGTTLGSTHPDSLVSPGVLRGGERLADTLSFTAATDATTPKGPFAAQQTGFGQGTAQAYSPADNTAAQLILPMVAQYAFLFIEFDLTGASGANVLLEPGRR